MPGPVVRGTTTAQGSGTSFSLAVPSGAVSTDRLILIIYHQNSIQLTTRPSGWDIASSTFGSGTFRVLTYGGSGSAGGNFVFNASTTYCAAMIAVEADPLNGNHQPDIEVSSILTQSASTGPAVTPTVDTLTNDDIVLSIAAWQRGTSFTPAVALTEFVDIRSGNASTDRSLTICSSTQPTAGSTGTHQIAVDNQFGYGSEGFFVGTIALRSAPPPSTWVGDFETGDTSQYRGLNYARSAGISGPVPRVEIRTDSPRQGTYYARFHADNSDIYPLTPTENPRCQLNGPRYLAEGDERWVSFSFRLPGDFPYVPYYPDGWLVIYQIYGSPYAGNPPIAVKVDGDMVALQLLGVTWVWRKAVPRDTWVDIAMRLKLSVDASIGWLELYHNGEQQLLHNGRRRVSCQTMPTSSNENAEPIPTIYRKHDAVPGLVVVDFDNLRIDPTPPPMVSDATTAESVRVQIA